MKLQFFILFIALPLQNVLTAAIQEPIIICAEPEFYFGAVTNDQVVTHNFTIENEGNFPLYITSIRTDCGCVASRLTDKTIFPGGKTQLKITFDLKKRSGRQFRRIIVESNDPQNPRLILAIYGEAVAPVEITPDQLWWGNLNATVTNEITCEINFSEYDQTYIDSVSAPAPFFKTELVCIEPRRKYRLTVRAIPPLPEGSIPSPLVLTTDHTRFAKIEIPMHGRIVGDIYSIPAEIVFSSKDGKTATRSLLLYASNKKKFNILNVDAPDAAAEIRLRPIAGSNGYRLDLHNLHLSPAMDGRCIVVTTDCVSSPVLNIPLRLQTEEMQ